MKAVVQRVKNASVTADGKLAGKISRGLLVYAGVSVNDSETDAVWLAEKVVNLRIFPDENGKMNLSVKDIITAGLEAKILAVSQFTLLGDCVKGRRPYYGEAAEPEKAAPLYEFFMEKIRENGIVCEAGIFRTHMQVESINDGPVTIILDSKAKES